MSSKYQARFQVQLLWVVLKRKKERNNYFRKRERERGKKKP
jgi:hypothetical protein